jgi:hypothetical protein
VISGGSAAITGTGSFGSTVINAGTINGNVSMSNGSSSSNVYVAATGGVLNGNLVLGVGDTLVTDFVNTGPGSFAGITGTVNANMSNLVYKVGADAAVSATAMGGFRRSPISLPTRLP